MQNTQFINFFSEKITSAIKKVSTPKKDAIAELLRVSPEALAAFEDAYSKQVLSQEPESFFEATSKQALQYLRNKDSQIEISEESFAVAAELSDRIVDELLSQTEIYVYDGSLSRTEKLKTLPASTEPVHNEDINKLPAELRPQLAGNLMSVDVAEPTYSTILWYYMRAQSGKNERDCKNAYNHFRQGLDILDLDALTYEIIGTNPNSMGHWLPQLVDACMGQDFFKVPATTIAKVPMPLLQLTRKDYMHLTQTTLSIVDKWAYQAFHLDDSNSFGC